MRTKICFLIVSLIVLPIVFILTSSPGNLYAQDSAIIEQLLVRIKFLEERVAELEKNCANDSKDHRKKADRNTGPRWTCKVISRKETFYGEGDTRGLAEKNAMKRCQVAQGAGYFCKLKDCSNE